MRAELETHRMLGYTPREAEQVVIFYTADGWLNDRPHELLPVVDGRLIYAPNDESVRRTLSLGELRKLVQARASGG